MSATLPMHTKEDKRRQPLPEEGQRRWQPLLEEELRQQQKRGSSVWAGGPPAEPLVNGGPAVGQPSSSWPWPSSTSSAAARHHDGLRGEDQHRLAMTARTTAAESVAAAVD